MTIPRWNLDDRWRSTHDLGRYTLFSDHEREVAELKRLLREWRRFHQGCVVAEANPYEDEAIDSRCDLCKRTDEVLGVKP